VESVILKSIKYPREQTGLQCKGQHTVLENLYTHGGTYKQER